MLPRRAVTGLLLAGLLWLAPALPMISQVAGGAVVSAPRIKDERAPFYLSQFRDRQLQADLEKLLARQGLSPWVGRRKLAVGVLDISDPARPRYAAVNPHHMMYAASLPKIAILLGAYRRASRGELKLDARTQGQLTDMIRYSDNVAATDMLNRVGRSYLIDLLQSEELRLYDPELNGGLWVGKDYGPVGAYRRDPLHNLSHGATVYQVLRYFFLLDRGLLVAPEYREQMLEKLSRPGIDHKFVAGLKRYPQARIYRKSGSWRNFHSDAALVELQGRRVVLVGITENSDGGSWLAELAAPLFQLVVAAPAPRGE